MPVVACPKCKTKFKLSSEMLGKAIRCTSCQAAFRTPAAANAKPAVKAKPAASPKSKATKPSPDKNAPPAPVKKKRTLEDELFSSAPPRPGAPDPLGNFVLEDPGFSTLELPDAEDDDDSNDDLFGDKKHLMENPAIKGRPSPSNPYASPGSSGSSSGNKKAAKALRRKYLKHEGEVRALGILYMFFGLVGVLASLAGVIMSIIGSESLAALPIRGTFFVLLIVGVLFLLYGSLFALGWFVNQLHDWAKIVITIFLVIGLLGFPVGTAINGYFLWVLHSEKGKAVFSDSYRAAVRMTPDMKPKQSIVLTIFFVLLGIVFAIAAVALLFGSST